MNQLYWLILLAIGALFAAREIRRDVYALGLRGLRWQAVLGMVMAGMATAAVVGLVAA